MPKTYAEQVAETLRKELQQGRWAGTMPGRDRLAGELAVNARTVDRALTMLENEGVLVPQGAGRRRKINRRKLRTKPSAIRVKIILYEQADFQLGYMVGLLHALRQRGHEASFASKSLSDLRMNVKRRPLCGFGKGRCVDCSGRFQGGARLVCRSADACFCPVRPLNKRALAEHRIEEMGCHG